MKSKLGSLLNDNGRRFLGNLPVECSDGWGGIIADVANQAPKWAIAAQVKEKFGGPRVYWTISEAGHESPPSEAEVDALHALVYAAEGKSFLVCAECGRCSKCAGVGYYRTLCDECRERLKRKQ